MSSSRLPTKPSGEPYTFMIVDDSEPMVINLKRIITSFGGEVVQVAKDGAQALTFYKALAIKPDIVTMDLTMPGTDGLTAISNIMKENPAQKIVVVSSEGSRDKVKAAIMKGAKHFIVKPFMRDDVADAFSGVLGLG